MLYFEEPEDPPAGDPVVLLEQPWEVFEPLTRQALALLEKDEAPRYPHSFDSHPGLYPRYSGIIYELPEGEPMHWSLQQASLANMGESEHHALLSQGWSHIEAAVPSGLKEGGEQTVVSLWRSDRVFERWPEDMLDSSYTGGTMMLGPMLPHQAAGIASQMEASGWRPIHVGANSFGTSSSMCVTFARRLTPLARAFVVYDPSDPPPFDRVPPPALSGVPHVGPLLGSSEPLPETGPPPWLGAKERRPPRARRGARLNRAKGILHAGGLGGHGGPIGNVEPEIIETLEEGLAIIDDAALTMMQRTRARALQLALGIDGRLPILRSYTHAEEGYPVLRDDQLMRPGSVSKALTAMAVVKLFALGKFLDEARNGLQVTLPAAFDFDPGPLRSYGDPRTETTIDHLLYHRSGWLPEEEVGAAWYEARCIQLSDSELPYAVPGDMRAFIAGMWPNTFYKWSPGDVEEYHGMTYRALGELVSRRLLANNPNRWGLYRFTMPLFWKMPDADPRVDFVLNSRESSVADRNHFPCHDQVPHVGIAPESGEAVPGQYAGNHDWGGGAGAWCMSMKTLARILHGMGASDRAPRLVDDLRRELLAEVWAPGSFARGWNAGTKKEKWAEIDPLTSQPTWQPLVEWRTLQHNGSTLGGSGFARFYYRDGSAETSSVAVAANLDRVPQALETFANKAWITARRMHRAFGLTGDHFDAE